MTSSYEDKPKDIELGLRYNDGKTRFDLIPFDALEALADIYTAGAKKYADRNWEKGLSWMATLGSLMRHTSKWVMGEKYDKELSDLLGRPVLHTAAIAWNAMALLTFELRGVGKDDRPNADSS